MCWPTMWASRRPFELVKLIMAKVLPRRPARRPAADGPLLRPARVVEGGRADRGPGERARDRRPASDLPHLDAHGGRPGPGLEPRRVHHPGDRVRGRGRSVRAVLTFLGGDRRDPSVPRAPCPGAGRAGWLPASSTGSAPAGTCGAARSRRPRQSSTRRSGTTGNVSRRSSSELADGVQQVVNRFATWLDTDGPNERRHRGRRLRRPTAGSGQERAGERLEHLG